MANAKFADLVDPRLLEAAWHRYEAARELAQANAAKRNADEIKDRAWAAHAKAVNDYDTLEQDVARGVRMGARQPQAVQS